MSIILIVFKCILLDTVKYNISKKIYCNFYELLFFLFFFGSLFTPRVCTPLAFKKKKNVYNVILQFSYC